MNWFFLLIAGLLEICWAIGLKYSEGLTKPLFAIFTAVTMILSVFLLGISLKTLPMGTAYAVWTGVGIVGTTIFGIFFFGESVSVLRILSILLIVTGIFGLKILSK